MCSEGLCCTPSASWTVGFSDGIKTRKSKRRWRNSMNYMKNYNYTITQFLTLGIWSPHLGCLLIIHSASGSLLSQFNRFFKLNLSSIKAAHPVTTTILNMNKSRANRLCVKLSLVCSWLKFDWTLPRKCIIHSIKALSSHHFISKPNIVWSNDAFLSTFLKIFKISIDTLSK